MAVDVPNSWDPDELSKGEALRLMSRPSRRNVVYALLEAEDGTLTRTELVNLLAAGQAGAPTDEVEPRLLRTVAESLEHTHLPKLHDAGVVSYDRQSERVELADSVADVRPLLLFTRDD